LTVDFSCEVLVIWEFVEKRVTICKASLSDTLLLRHNPCHLASGRDEPVAATSNK